MEVRGEELVKSLVIVPTVPSSFLNSGLRPQERLAEPPLPSSGSPLAWGHSPFL